MIQLYTIETLTGLLIIAVLFLWRWAGGERGRLD